MDLTWTCCKVAKEFDLSAGRLGGMSFYMLFPWPGSLDGIRCYLRRRHDDGRETQDGLSFPGELDGLRAFPVVGRAGFPWQDGLELSWQTGRADELSQEPDGHRFPCSGRVDVLSLAGRAGALSQQLDGQWSFPSDRQDGLIAFPVTGRARCFP